MVSSSRPSLLLLALAAEPWCQSYAYRVAVIGGGISGTFATKYLAEYDVFHREEAGDTTTRMRDCLVDEIIVYDVSPPSATLLFAKDNHDTDDDNNNNLTNSYTNVQQSYSSIRSSSDPRPQNRQGSRVSSITLMDGSVVELGASIIYEGNQLVVDMMNGDPIHLKRETPNGIGKDVNGPPSGFGIYHGNQKWLLNTASLFSKYPSFLQPILKRLYLLWRYNLDLLRLGRAVKQAMQSFDSIYLLLNDTQHDVTYFNSPMDIWHTVGLRSLASITFHEFLDGIGLYRDPSLELAGGASSAMMNYSSGWDWRKWVPGMGCMRAELLSAMTINTYNQDLNQMNGLVGLAAYISAVGQVFSVKGGNHQLLESALHQARALYHASTCSSPSRERIQQLQKTITTVVASENSMELFEGTESLGHFDVVILAAPLQQCCIEFLVRSPMGLDDTVLHEMPLGGIKENIDLDDVSPSSKVDNNEYGQHLFSPPLPSSATVPYTSVVTTLVSNATLNTTHFGLRDDEPLPQTIFVSERGKLIEGITTLTIIQNGLVKTFSSDVLDADHRNMLFGDNHILEYVQVWGGREHGRYGGATPNFAGGLNTESLPFLLYDGVEHWGKKNPILGPALYYTNAIESAIAAMEISALGAKSTAKLVARRLGLIRPKDGGGAHDEL